jgi:hypothetical protein
MMNFLGQGGAPRPPPRAPPAPAKYKVSAAAAATAAAAAAAAATGAATAPAAAAAAVAAVTARGAKPVKIVKIAQLDEPARDALAAVLVERALGSANSGGAPDLWAAGAGLVERNGGQYSCLIDGCRAKGANDGGSGSKVASGATSAWAHVISKHLYLAPLPFLQKYAREGPKLIKKAVSVMEAASSSEEALIQWASRAAGGSSGKSASELPAGLPLVGMGKNEIKSKLASAIGRGCVVSGVPINQGVGALVGCLISAVRPDLTALMPSRVTITKATDRDHRRRTTTRTTTMTATQGVSRTDCKTWSWSIAFARAASVSGLWSPQQAQHSRYGAPIVNLVLV